MATRTAAEKLAAAKAAAAEKAAEELAAAEAAAEAEAAAQAGEGEPAADADTDEFVQVVAPQPAPVRAPDVPPSMQEEIGIFDAAPAPVTPESDVEVNVVVTVAPAYEAPVSAKTLAEQEAGRAALAARMDR